MKTYQSMLDVSDYKKTLCSWIVEYKTYKVTLPNSGYREFKSKAAFSRWFKGFEDGIQANEYLSKAAL